MEEAYKVYGLLEKNDRVRLFIALTIMLISAVVELFGIVSIVPFLTIATDPDILSEGGYLADLYTALEYESHETFLITLIGFSLVTIICTNVMRTLTIWYNYKVSLDLWHKYFTRVFNYYLHLPYDHFVQRNSAEMTDKLITRVNSMIAGMVTPSLLIIMNSVTGVLVVLLLVWEDFYLTALLTAMLIIFYSLIYRQIRNRMDVYGNTMTELGPQLLKIVSEAFGGIKEIKVLGKENKFLSMLFNRARLYADTDVKHQIVTALPAGAIEVMAFGSLVLIGLYLMALNHDIKSIVPTLGLYMYASRRLQPAMQGIFQNLSQIKYYQASLRAILPDVQAAVECEKSISEESRRSDSSAALVLENSLQVQGVCYSYPEAKKLTIENITLRIPALYNVGIVGESGAGKTTLIDIVLGLLDPSSGKILIDDIEIGPENITGWRSMIGYVPQSVYLADDTVKNNIAFGEDDKSIDSDRVYMAAKLAQIDSFIMNEMPAQYDTYIGERGVRISGGQRQRLGIARALYHDPDILILDEATSSLDRITEAEFMSSVEMLAKKKTIISISHRLSTVESCDLIFVLENGSIAARGSYKELLESNQLFANMVSTKNNVTGKTS